jgi:hypothetical protein
MTPTHSVTQSSPKNLGSIDAHLAPSFCHEQQAVLPSTFEPLIANCLGLREAPQPQNAFLESATYTYYPFPYSLQSVAYGEREPSHSLVPDPYCHQPFLEYAVGGDVSSSTFVPGLETANFEFTLEEVPGENIK